MTGLCAHIIQTVHPYTDSVRYSAGCMVTKVIGHDFHGITNQNFSTISDPIPNFVPTVSGLTASYSGPYILRPPVQQEKYGIKFEVVLKGIHLY